MLEDFLNLSGRENYLRMVRENSADLFLAHYVKSLENWGGLSSGVLHEGENEFSARNLSVVVSRVKDVIEEICEAYVHNPTKTSWICEDEKVCDDGFRFGLKDFVAAISYSREHYEDFPFLKRAYWEEPSELGFEVVNEYRRILGLNSLQEEKERVGKFCPKSLRENSFD